MCEIPNIACQRCLTLACSIIIADRGTSPLPCLPLIRSQPYLREEGLQCFGCPQHSHRQVNGQLPDPLWTRTCVICQVMWGPCRQQAESTPAFFFFFFWVTGEVSTGRQMKEAPGLSPNNGLENASLSDQSMASIPARGKQNVLAPRRPALMARPVMS